MFNVDGDGGAVALRRLVAERGNGELAMMMGLGVVGATVTSPGSDQVTAATPIARLIQEPQAVLVPAGSRHRDIGELVAGLAGRPGRRHGRRRLGPGGPDHLMSMQLAQAAGIDPARVRYQPFDGGGALLPRAAGRPDRRRRVQRGRVRGPDQLRSAAGAGRVRAEPG